MMKTTDGRIVVANSEVTAFGIRKKQMQILHYVQDDSTVEERTVCGFVIAVWSRIEKLGYENM